MIHYHVGSRIIVQYSASEAINNGENQLGMNLYVQWAVWSLLILLAPPFYANTKKVYLSCTVLTVSTHIYIPYVSGM